MTDRRRVNGPGGPTFPPLYDDDWAGAGFLCPRTRPSANIRPFYLKTGVTPSASGSAYLEIAPREGIESSGMKLICTVHGPRSLPRSAAFSPHMILTAHVKYAPFATRQRRGYLRDTSEKDLTIHLETALRGALIVERWPKSGVDVTVTILEGELSCRSALQSGFEEWDIMKVLGGCITIASAALTDAGIDCVDTVSGGVAALVVDNKTQSIVLDPVPLEHTGILATCCVAYLPNRDEITSIWFKGQVPISDVETHRNLVSNAIQACKGAHQVLAEALNDTMLNSH